MPLIVSGVVFWCAHFFGFVVLSIMSSDHKFRVEPLNGEADYAAWAQVMVNLMKSEGVFRYIKSDVAAPVVPTPTNSNGEDVRAAELAEDTFEMGAAKAMLLMNQNMAIVPKTFVQQSTLLSTGTPFQLWEALKAKYSVVSYALQLDLMAEFHELQVGAGGLVQFVDDLRVVRSKILTAKVTVSEFDLKCKLFAACNGLPDTVRSFVYSNLKGETHKNLTFDEVSVLLLSFTKSTVVNTPVVTDQTSALLASVVCKICNLKHFGTCWGPIGSAQRERNIAAWKKTRNNKKKDEKVVAGVAMVPDDMFSANLNSNDPYVMCGVCTPTTDNNTVPRNLTKWIADSGAGRHMARTGTPTKPATHVIGCANGEVLRAKGSVDMGKLKDVLVVPKLAYNLASIGCLCDTGGGYH